MGLRIRWPGAVKGAAVAIGALVALAVLQAALKPQEPPPLPADVGLPQARATATAAPARPARTRRRGASGWRALRRIANRKNTARGPQAVPDPRRSAAGDKPSRQGSPPVPLPPPVPMPAPPPSPDAPPQPPPPAAASPAPAPSPPADGSMEFAPR